MSPTSLAVTFERCAARWVDQPAFYDGPTAVSYGELARQSRELRRAFMDLGVGPGDRVVILSGLRIEWVVAALATLGLGADFVPFGDHARDPRTAKVFLFDAAAVLAEDVFPDVSATHAIDLDGLDDADYRSVIARGRRDPAAPIAAAPTPFVSALPLALADRVVTTTSTTDADLRVWTPLLSGAAIAPTDDVPATCALVRPTVIIASPAEATQLADTMLAAVAPAYTKLFALKLAAARRRRALHASGRRSTLLNLGHLLVDRVAGRHARAIFGQHLRLVVATGPMPAATREHFELVGIATLDRP